MYTVSPDNSMNHRKVLLIFQLIKEIPDFISNEPLLRQALLTGTVRAF